MSDYNAISFNNNKQTGAVGVNCELIECNGYSSDYSFETGDNGNTYINLQDEKYIKFKDKYNIIQNNFSLKVWMQNIVSNYPFIKIYNEDNENSCILINYSENHFIATKYLYQNVVTLFSNTKTYNVSDIVSYNNIYYQCTTSSIGNLPIDYNYFEQYDINLIYQNARTISYISNYIDFSDSQEIYLFINSFNNRIDLYSTIC